ncbi:hypothetical protein, partial [Anaerobiospirillum succiniciproducens]|uniref:hypothetical protein n=1 Tax=Anaerobiospirillum succiniciproducens TaxID=13335 RepID=UPI0004823192
MCMFFQKTDKHAVHNSYASFILIPPKYRTHTTHPAIKATKQIHTSTPQPQAQAQQTLSIPDSMAGPR